MSSNPPKTHTQKQEPKTKKEEIKSYVAENFERAMKKETMRQLGDRSKYIGASDIGGCLRKAYLSKKEDVRNSVRQMIVFKRGHLAEDIVETMIDSDSMKLHKQVEVSGESKGGLPIKAHIDFVCEKQDGSFAVVEVKSTKTPVDTPYESWVLQTQLQMELLKTAYPKKEIRGYVFAIDVNTGWYEPFEVKPNKILAHKALNRAQKLSEAIKSDKEPEADVQLYCSECPFIASCPKIHDGMELPDDVTSAVERVKRYKEQEKEVKELKKQLKTFMEAAQINSAIAGETPVKYVEVEGTEVYDAAALKRDNAGLLNRFGDELEQYKKTAGGFSYVRVF